MKQGTCAISVHVRRGETLYPTPPHPQEGNLDRCAAAFHGRHESQTSRMANEGETKQPSGITFEVLEEV